jgi:isorenieratene synthase
MHRRRFLRATAGVVGAGSVVGAGALWSVQPRQAFLVAADSHRPRRLPAQRVRRVVVVGGGLGGIAAATVLAGRGYTVTLLEQAQHLGGKVGGWHSRVGGVDVPVEHGFHGFFHQYFNLRGLLQDAGALVPSSFSPASAYPVAFADRPTELFGTSTTLFPLNLLDVIRRSPSLRFAEFRHAEQLLEMARWDGERTYARLDGVDFATWARDARVPPAMVDLVLRPFGETTLNRMERLSAAEALKFFHFYFTGSPTGLGFDLATKDTMSAVVDPLARRLTALGGTIRTGARVSRLVVEGGGVRGVVVGDETPLVRVPIPWGADDTAFVDVGGVPAWCRRRRDGAGAVVDTVAFDLRCTHQGCPVQPVPSTTTTTTTAAADAAGFSCPCHGGRYDGAGTPIAGPPPAPLRRLPIVHDVDGDAVVAAATGGERIDADAVIVACDTRGARGLLSRSDLVPRVDTGGLAESEPFCIVRLWLDKPVRPDRAPFYTTSRFVHLDSLAIYSAFQEPFVAQARAGGGAVVELHAYAIPAERLAAPDVLADALAAEMLVVLPELAGARTLHREVQLQASFTRFAPGDHPRRPRTDSGVPGLLFAGDWVKIDAPVALMEGATVAGKCAANHLLQADGLAAEPIPIVAPRGPLA